ncbi:MAG: metal-binding protein [Cyanobacteriota bacterium]|nr:metal-binding protein [Cyanobacteriota bacterium]
MASGNSHDRATWALALPFGALWWPWLGLAGAAVASACFVAGGLLLSPDLDTRSNATRRWGPLKLLWWPYRRLLSHRSLISHTPLIGSAGRLLYLAGLAVGLCLLAGPLGAPQPAQLIATAQELWQQQRPLLMAALAGVEASAWLHLIQDGDPMPRLPRVLRQWRRKPKPRRHARAATRMGRHKRAS